MRRSALLAATLLVAGASGSMAGDKAQEIKPYPFAFCIVSGETLDPYAEPYSAVHEGQRYRFCCKDCLVEFRNDPAPFAEKFKKLLENQKATDPKSGPKEEEAE